MIILNIKLLRKFIFSASSEEYSPSSSTFVPSYSLLSGRTPARLLLPVPPLGILVALCNSLDLSRIRSPLQAVLPLADTNGEV